MTPIVGPIGGMGGLNLKLSISDEGITVVVGLEAAIAGLAVAVKSASPTTPDLLFAFCPRNVACETRMLLFEMNPPCLMAAA